MKPPLLLAFLRNDLSVDDFLRSIEIELMEYIRTRRKIGASSHIVFEGELHPNDMNQDNLIYIMNAYLSRKLGEWELEYLFKWTEMAEVFDDNESIEKILFDFSTPEINYPINKNNIKEAISFLKKEKSRPEYSGDYDKKAYSSKVIGF